MLGQTILLIQILFRRHSLHHNGRRYSSIIYRWIRTRNLNSWYRFSFYSLIPLWNYDNVTKNQSIKGKNRKTSVYQKLFHNQFQFMNNNNHLKTYCVIMSTPPFSIDWRVLMLLESKNWTIFSTKAYRHWFHDVTHLVSWILNRNEHFHLLIEITLNQPNLNHCTSPEGKNNFVLQGDWIIFIRIN
jgi:hypothetical protein